MALPTKKIPELTAYGLKLQGSEELEIWAASTSRRVTARDFVLPDVDSIVTAVNQAATLTKSRRLTAGTGISIVDGGPGSTITISMLGTGALPGNPTALVSTVAVNGVATTWMRSDAAPAIDQGMQPTWTQEHIFSALVAANVGPIHLQSANPGILFEETDAAAANRLWDIVASSEQLRGRVKSDDGVTAVNWLAVDRTGTVVDTILFSVNGGSAQVENAVTLASFQGLSATMLLATSTNPSVYINDTDSPVDEKVWRLNAVAGDLVWSTRTDINGGGVTFLTIARTGTTVDTITWGAPSVFSSTVQFNNNVSAAANILISSTGPTLRFNETDAAANNRLWDIFVNGELFTMRMVDDAISSGVPFLQANRTLNVADDVTIIATNIVLTSTSTSTSGSLQVTGASVNIANAAPRFIANETDAPANEKIFDIASIAGDWLFRTRTDADAAGATFVTVTRTGTVVDSIALAATAITLNGVAVSDYARLSQTNTFTAANSGPTAYPVLASSATPAIGFNETDAAANNRLWDLIANGEQFVHRVLSDAGVAVNYEVVDRTANVVDQIAWTATAFIFTGIVTRPTVSQQRDSFQSVTWNAGANNLDLNGGNLHRITLQGNVTLSFTNPPPNSSLGVTFTIFLLQDATGSRTVTWPASVHWDSGTTPVLTTTPSRLDAVTLTTFDGGTTYYGGQVLANVVP